MSKAYDFLMDCEAFFVVTMNGDFPAARPFGVVAEDGEYLYIATHDGNEAHKQLRNCGNMQIVAKKTGTRDWIRITGVAEEINDTAKKQWMIDECPRLVKHYGTGANEHYLLFRVRVLDVVIK